MIKVLFAASEAAPFIKTGGLADVMQALSQALVKKKVDARVILPKYQTIPYELQKQIKHIKHFTVQLGWRNQYCGIEECEYNGVTYYFIDNQYYFGREGVYGYFDDAERFAFFSKAVLETLNHIDFIPDIINCNDWQTALIPIYYNAFYSYLGNIKTVLTIHNLEYQGVFDGNVAGEVFGLGDNYFHPYCLEHFGDVNTLKGGLYTCDYITTVSPSYSSEIQTPQHGYGLDGVIRECSYKLKGILNGIDISEYNPWSDAYLAKRFSKAKPAGKAANKIMLQRQLGLSENQDIPLVAIVGRLVHHKGLDLINEALGEIMAMPIQLAVLGTGEQLYERILCDTALRCPGKMSAQIRFDSELARRIYAGADLLLMPSISEPCGLSQLIAMRYGTLPLARETGGLKDTVIPYNQFTSEGNGFSFSGGAYELAHVLKNAVELYYNNHEAWNTLMANAMQGDYSFTKSAGVYAQLYKELIGEQEGSDEPAA